MLGLAERSPIVRTVCYPLALPTFSVPFETGQVVDITDGDVVFARGMAAMSAADATLAVGEIRRGLRCSSGTTSSS